MELQLAQFLKKATEHCNNQECDLREDYSGRGMYGRTTAAIVVERETELLLNVIQYVKEASDHNPAFLETIPDVSAMGDLRTDSMGHDVVIY